MKKKILAGISIASLITGIGFSMGNAKNLAKENNLIIAKSGWGGWGGKPKSAVSTKKDNVTVDNETVKKKKKSEESSGWG